MKKGKFLLMAAMCVWAGLAIQSPAWADLEFGLDCDNDEIIDASCYVGMEATIIAGLYVSNVDTPGLVNMAFTLTYDDSVLNLNQGGTAVDTDNWLLRETDLSMPGEITMSGGRLRPGLAGDMIRLATISFIRTAPGQVDLTIFTRDDPDASVDDFVLEDYTVLDDNLNGGLLVAEITDSQSLPPDSDNDMDVDGLDVVFMIDYLVDCTGGECFTLDNFAGMFGLVYGGQEQ